MKKTLLLLLSCLGFSLAAIAQNIIYVNINVSGGANNGTSWANAYNNLATAIDNASEGKQLWVAKGTYQPASGGAFGMVKGVSFYGGFVGIETSLDQRNFAANLTILKGNGTRVIQNYENGLTATDVLDGFTITGGVSNTSGGGMINMRVSPSIRNCTFVSNSANFGGGIVFYFSTSTITNCIFQDNSSLDGGGVYTTESSLTFLNCFFKGNSASYGGGINNSDSRSVVTIINTTIIGNTPQGLYDGSFSGGGSVLQNSIVWDNIYGRYTANNSLIKDKTDTNNGNINASGLTVTDIFNNYAGGDYTLKPKSPAINTGSNNLYVNLGANTLDLNGNPRVYNYVNSGTIDLGAYEYQGLNIAPDANNILYVNSGVTGGNGLGNSWANALKNLADALKYAKQQQQANNAIYNTTPLKIYVAKGTYKPLYSPGKDNFGVDAGRDNSFLLVPNAAIYGGFAGNETSLEQRNLRTNQTILSGDLDNNDVVTGGISTTITGSNAYRVVLSGGDMGSAILDGFTITGGNANGSGELWVTSGLNNFEQGFLRTDGAGIFNRDSGGAFPAPTIRNCRISGNQANNLGGGMANYNSSPNIIDCIISGNSAGTTAGGMRNSGNAATKVIGTLIYDNVAPSGAGVSSTTSSITTFTNCTIASNGDGLNVTSASPQINNTIIWDGVTGNYTASNSIIKGKSDMSNNNVDATNVTEGQLFIFYQFKNFTLRPGSPALNKGSNSFYTGLSASTLDLTGNKRLISGKIDIGAYESQNVIATPDANKIVYVNINADGSGDGSSWSNAVKQLQPAIDGLPTGGEVWVAKGTYLPEYYFSMKPNVAIYGGFVGGETTLSQRNPVTNLTTLYSNGNTVIRNQANGLTATAILDGFTITGANANNYQGGGMFNSNVSPTINNCIFKDNLAAHGGGMYNTFASPVISNCLFIGNSGAASSGAMYSEEASPKIINTTFVNNGGEGFFIRGSITPMFYNSILWDNIRFDFGANNYTAKNSLIKNNINTADGNIDATGLTEASIFNNHIGGDYTLKSGSPALNKGDNSLYGGLSAASLDLAVNKRLIGSKIDIGAYENQTLVITPDANNIVYVNSNADGTGDGSSWAYATTQLRAAIDGLPQGGGQVWVAKGTYQIGANGFKMKNDVTIYGGFSEGETSLGQRNYMANLTILRSNGNVIKNDNNGLTATAILDGFTITSESTGMYNVNSSPTIVNCSFLSNGSNGIANKNSSPTIVNCLIAGNHDSGLYNEASSFPNIINSTIAGNNGNALFNSNSAPILHNSIVWGGVVGSYTASHSLVKDKTDVTNGNLDGTIYNESQIFTNATGGDYSLKAGSPVVNKGDNALYTAVGGNISTDKDLAGNPRLFDGTIDLGAYESQVDDPLPVNFGKFTAALQNNRIKLAWNTFSEPNNETFTVYRSSDGINYIEIVRQTSKGNGANSYIAYDNSPLNGLNYYRLKQQDTDGTITELGDEAVNFSLRNEEVKAWPNPVEKILKLSFPAGKYQSLSLTDVSGRKLQEHILNKTQSQAELDLSSYPKGIYLIALKGSNGSHLLKVLK